MDIDGREAAGRPAALDGEKAGRAGCEHSKGRDLGSRKHGLKVAEVEEWRDRFLLGAENALRSRPKDEEALKDEQIKKLKQKIGDLVLDNDILKDAMKGRPLALGTSDE